MSASRPPETRPVPFDLTAVEAADLDCIDHLARITLNAARLGLTLHFVHANTELRDLVTFVGLDEVLHFADDPDR